MDKDQSAFLPILFALISVVMTALVLPYTFGVAFLKALRRRSGRSFFWSFTALLSTCLFLMGAKPLALAFFSLVILMGVFSELEEMGLSFSTCTFLTVLINGLISAGGFALWVYFTGPNWQSVILSSLETILRPVNEMNPHLQLSYSGLMLQLPSLLAILWIVGIYVAVLLESRLRNNIERDSWPPLRPQLSNFRLPDVWVWVFIASLLGSFGSFDMPIFRGVAVNVMNLCVVLFFFQGIAVVGRFFENIRMSTFWQSVFMFVLIVQLFLFVSLLGIMDYWLDFRSRIAKRAESFNREA